MKCKQCNSTIKVCDCVLKILDNSEKRKGYQKSYHKHWANENKIARREYRKTWWQKKNEKNK